LFKQEKQKVLIKANSGWQQTPASRQSIVLKRKIENIF
jgi:hypothetical protein